MNKTELIEAVSKLGASAGPSDPQQSTDRDLGHWEAIADVLKLVEQLDSPVAMEWHDEPSAEGWYWAQFAPWFPIHWTGGTWVSSDEVDLHKLGRVCLIPEAPEWPTGAST